MSKELDPHHVQIAAAYPALDLALLLSAYGEQIVTLRAPAYLLTAELLDGSRP